RRLPYSSPQSTRPARSSRLTAWPPRGSVASYLCPASPPDSAVGFRFRSTAGRPRYAPARVRAPPATSPVGVETHVGGHVEEPRDAARVVAESPATPGLRSLRWCCDQEKRPACLTPTRDVWCRPNVDPG